MGNSALLIGAASMMMLLNSYDVGITQSNSVAPDVAAVKSSNNDQRSESQNHVVGHTAWDDDFFYVALQVNKPTLSGKNSEPFSNPLEDDAVIISLQTDNNRQARARTANTYTIVVSEAGGAQLYSGPDSKPLFNGLKDLSARLEDINKNEKDEQKRKDRSGAILGSIIKVAVNPKGIPRDGGGAGAGYTVEVAIPWTDLGGKPVPGARMGFNVTAQSRSAGSPDIQSLSPQVLSALDVDNPELWNLIIFASNAAATVGSTITSPRVILSSKPAIDGDVSQGEWSGLSVFEFGDRALQIGNSFVSTVASRSPLEYVRHPSRPVVPVDAAHRDVLATPRRPQRVSPLVIAKYEYDFQGDSRKAAPSQNVLRPDNSSAITHHPYDGSGPWFSYDRTDWHRNLLLEARREGIDVVLPVYRGNTNERKRYSDKGLMVLSSALRSLRASGQEYPQVGLYLDAQGLVDAPDDHIDLHDQTSLQKLYSAIRDFYRAIPAPFRYVVPLSAENGGRKAVPVFLSNATTFINLDSNLSALLRSRFTADFPDYDLIIVGGEGFTAAHSIDAFVSDSADQGVTMRDGGWIKIASVSGGHDEEAANAAPKLTRKNGDTYRASWQNAVAKKPDWIFLDSWNDYGTGAEIAPSMETGYSTADLTRVYTRMFAGTSKNGVKFVWNNAPQTMLSGMSYSVGIRAQNTGLEGWAAQPAPGQNALGFAYRWHSKSGAVVASGPVNSITSSVFGGSEVSETINIDAKSQGNSAGALPGGDYLLEIGAVTTDRKGGRANWLDSSNNLSLPIHIAAVPGEIPEMAATLLRSDLPADPESGSVYEVNASFRNDGAATWRIADGARATIRLYRRPLDDASGDGNLVATADATTLLDHDVLPGQEVDARIVLPLLDGEGKPLPVWHQDDDWQYVARWEIAEDKHLASSAAHAVTSSLESQPQASSYGISFDPSPVGITDFDFGQRFTLDQTPASLPGDKRLPVRLELQNNGPQTWKKGAVRIGYHWYYQDGTEFYFENETTAITEDVPTGGHVKDFLAWVTAPPYDGAYWLVWDVKFGDTWASTIASTRNSDILVHPIQVIGGRLTFTDLSKYYNVAGSSYTDNLKAGDFDSKGRSFPGTELPPFPDTPIVGQSLWLPSAKIGPDSPRRISYHWGSKDSASRNFVSCIGQRIELGKDSGTCRILHIVAASSGQDVSTSLRLVYQEPSSQSEDLYSINISRWDSTPSNGEEVAFRSELHHEGSGVKDGAVMLYHYTITIKDPRKLVALILPDRPDIKIAAITIEK